MTGADLVVKMLEEYGVRYVFGLPGDTSVALYEAFRRSRKVEHVLTRDERSSAYMADAYAKITGAVGVCEGPSGGGALYLIPGVSESDGSRVPLVSLTTDTPLSSDGRGSLTSLDQVELFGPVCRLAARVLQPAKVPESMRRAFRYATAPRQGATQVILPEDVLSGPVCAGGVADLYAEERHASFPAYRYSPPAAEVEAAAALLARASRPIILCGGGLHLSGAGDELRQLAEETSTPVVTTLNGKGSLEEVHPLSLGVCGGNGAKQATNEAVRNADVVLIVGSRLNSTSTAGGSIFNDGARLVQVDLDPAQIGNNYRLEVGLAGDARPVLAALAVLSRPPGDDRRHWARGCREAVRQELDAYEQCAAADCSPFLPHLVVRALERTLPGDSILLCDAGTPTPYVAAYYRPATAGRTFIAGRAHGSLGYALPAAIGAKIGAPDRTVAALFGDGSFGMACGELETIGRRRLPLILISFRNGCYSWIKCLQKLYYNEGYFGVDLGVHADYSEVARACGIHAARPGSGPELEEELRRAVASDAPAFVEVMTGCMTGFTPPVAAWQRDSRLDPEQRQRKSY
ncbi:MAG: thiamine pyrophosphate-binding protein [bacterium]|nr:thiamine pyrophosphate-binding protein [bacterium]